ncbi:hypothetical protein UA08_08074 [Talaromyces atroroseus]|uniref:Probable glucan endo-1,3-beta-glucosidase eglC n=1 Tax=Talaromyces atroroseus TaxID=1441469 RepID=A0A225ALG7_TALAT|nr:hypothetical protein UA08_08074 [Talaromyces atroroseus]OKL56399.1 hypothetical protein UA08_08074 [Talaromyces atroroseus]
MKAVTNAVALAMAVSPAAAAYKGFNYGATNDDGSARQQSDFEAQFETAKGLVGAEDFTSARLYTMVQGDTTNTPISAIPAAIAQNVTLLLGLWASGDTFDNEVAALQSAISTYGDELGSLVVGISVGSEDLYRNSVAGIEADAGIGKNPSTIVDDIKTVRSTISGTALDGVPVGHVDTWTAWANSSNSAVIDVVDWLGLDAYPFFQNTDSNSISNGKSLFQAGMDQVNAVAGGKPLWVTETGWPVTGTQQGLAIASADNAKTYWDDVGCGLLFDNVNTYWYILQDYGASPSFGVVGSELTTTPLYNLTCPAVSTSTSSSVSSTATATSSVGSSTGTVSPSNPPSSSLPSASSLSSQSSGSDKTPGSATSASPSSVTLSASSSVTPGSATVTSTPTPGVIPSNSTVYTPSGATTPGSTGTKATSSPTVSPYTGGASSVSASVTGIVAAIFALVVAF